MGLSTGAECGKNEQVQSINAVVWVFMQINVIGNVLVFGFFYSFFWCLCLALNSKIS